MNQGWTLFANKGTHAYVVYSGGREEDTHTQTDTHTLVD